MVNNKTILSDQALLKIKLNDLPQYRLASLAGFSPDVLSRWICGSRIPKQDDTRLRRLAKVLDMTLYELVRRNAS